MVALDEDLRALKERHARQRAKVAELTARQGRLQEQEASVRQVIQPLMQKVEKLEALASGQQQQQ